MNLFLFVLISHHFEVQVDRVLKTADWSQFQTKKRFSV